MKLYLALACVIIPLLGYGQTLDCQVTTKHTQTSTPTCKQTVCGKVQDAKGRAIAYARIGWQTQSERITSDEHGKFCIDKQDNNLIISAWAEGFLIGGSKIITNNPVIISLKALPPSQLLAQDYTWFDSVPIKDKHYPSLTPTSNEPCSACHPRLSKEWQQSAHGNAHNNETLKVLLAGIPTARQGKCQQCHNPQQAREANSAQPIGCDYCHKIKSIDNSQPEIFGSARITHHIPKDGALAFAQLDDPLGRNDYYAPLYTKSEYCGGCHQASFWRTPIYSTFSEWQKSPQGKQQVQCQDCHMKTQATLSAAAKLGGKKRASHTLSSHNFEISKETISAAIDFNVSQKILNQQLALNITMTNQGAGHDIPSGNPMRHLLLRVLVQDENGNSIKQVNGSQLPRWSLYSGDAGAVMAKLLTAKRYYDSLQLQVYPAPFWLPSNIEADTRLKAKVPQQHKFTFATAKQYHIKVQLWYAKHYINWQGLTAPTLWLLHERRDQINVPPFNIQTTTNKVPYENKH